jgi:LPS O-antigen subunit length determinant protein (WzzB/FepE family)
MNENNRSILDPPEPSPPVARKGRYKSALLGVLILFFGMVIGAGVVLYAGHKVLYKALHPGHEMAEHLTRRIDRKLDLTDAQETQVRKIVNLRVAAFRGVLVEAYPEILEQFDLLRTDVEQLLTEEQAVKWKAHYQNIRKRILHNVPPSPPSD